MANPIQLTSLSTEPRRDPGPIRIKHQDKAAYGVGGKGFYDDKRRLWNPGQAMYFEGEPNLDLFPLNKLAHDRKNEFLAKLNKFGEAAAKKAGKSFVPYEINEWNDAEDHDDIPAPKYLTGMQMTDAEPNEAIR